MPPDGRGGMVVNRLDSGDLGWRRIFLFAEEKAGAQEEAARRQAVVLGITQLALGHRGSLVVEVPAVQPDLDVPQTVADARGPGEIVRREGRVALVQEAAPHPARPHRALPPGAFPI